VSRRLTQALIWLLPVIAAFNAGEWLIAAIGPDAADVDDLVVALFALSLSFSYLTQREMEKSLDHYRALAEARWPR